MQVASRNHFIDDNDKSTSSKGKSKIQYKDYGFAEKTLNRELEEKTRIRNAEAKTNSVVTQSNQKELEKDSCKKGVELMYHVQD